MPDTTGESAQRVDLSLQQDADIARHSLAGVWAGLGLAQFALLAGNYTRVHVLAVTLFALGVIELLQLHRQRLFPLEFPAADVLHHRH